MLSFFLELSALIAVITMVSKSCICDAVIFAKETLLLSWAAASKFRLLPSTIGSALTAMSASYYKHVLSLSIFTTVVKSPTPAPEPSLCHVHAFLKKQIWYIVTTLVADRVCIVFYFESSGVPVDGPSCWCVLCAFYFSGCSWSLVPRCSPSLQDVFLLLVIFSQDNLPSSDCSSPRVGQPLLSIPVLAHNERRTLYYRESKCFCRGPGILRRTSHCTRMSELGYDT